MTFRKHQTCHAPSGNRMMTSCAATEIETRKDMEITTVNMGQINAVRGPNRLKAIVGSCIGVAIYHSRLQTGVLAHVVLPESSGRNGSPGKFADTAVPHMLELLKKMGVPPAGLVAKIAGGASMFAASGPMEVGVHNIEAVSRALKTAMIRITGTDVGGTKGRRLIFDCSSGEFVVEIIGKPPRTL